MALGTPGSDNHHMRQRTYMVASNCSGSKAPRDHPSRALDPGSPLRPRPRRLAEEETSSAISHVVSYCPKPIGFHPRNVPSTGHRKLIAQVLDYLVGENRKSKCSSASFPAPMHDCLKNCRSEKNNYLDFHYFFDDFHEIFQNFDPKPCILRFWTNIWMIFEKFP